MSSPAPRRFGLDLLRAASACGVMAAHSFLVLQPHPPDFPYVHALGLLGVELFFVLSGFLIGGIVLDLGEKLRDPAAVLHFWRRRWLRTIPNYLLFLGIWWFILHRLGASLPQPWRFLTFTQNLFSAPLGAYLESWSLCVEEWFYLLFPLGIMAGLRSRLPPRRALLCTTLVLLTVPALLRLWHVAAHQPRWDMDVRMVVIYRLDSIAWGILAALLRVEFPGLWQRARWPALAVGVSGLLYLAHYYLFTPLHPDWFGRTWMFAAISASGMCLLPRLDTWQTASTRFPFRSVRALARWSYSLYLVNLPTAFLLQKVVALPEAASTPGRSATALVAYFTLCLSLSALVYRCWERPWMDRR
ncbi:MAG: acyltransferase [Verrucomicrobia bacterium]|nr:acyltransferase [Verrucomicrobiota bacterium]